MSLSLQRGMQEVRRGAVSTCENARDAPANREWWLIVVDSTVHYVVTLKDSSGTLMIESKWKTGFVGFIVCLRHIKDIFDRLVACTDPHNNYLTTYKLSKDAQISQ